MASNSFGNLFRITTWGESHGKAVGVVIDGCPAGVAISDETINVELGRRAPGNSPYTSPRKEKDEAEILSGVFEGNTTGTPISILIPNRDADSSKYHPIRSILRPGHANFTYLEKYGIFDYRGGGRSSARETACRVAAGAVAKKLLAAEGAFVFAYLDQVASITCGRHAEQTEMEHILGSSIFCPDRVAEEQIKQAIAVAIEEGDSLGGIVAFVARGVPIGLGDPIYEKVEANLAKAMMSIPATKGFEIGAGFHSTSMQGSEHNDRFMHEEDRISTKTNHAGGTLGGITTGMPIIGRVAFKPTASIQKMQQTLDTEGKISELSLPAGSRHDPCVAIRAVPVVEAMAALVLADALLLNRSSKL